MSLSRKLLEELRAVALTTFYFAVWFGSLALLKALTLEEYHIGFGGASFALIGALIVAKVVLVLEHVSLGEWVRRRPPLVDVLLRTLLFALGVLVVLVLEKAFDGRHEYGGFAASLAQVTRHVDFHHVWIDAMCVTGALLVFNALAVVRRHLGRGGLARLFLTAPVARGGETLEPPQRDS